MTPDLAEALVGAMRAEGIDPGALGLAWARVSPTLVIVPAFGLRALPASGRAAMALLLAATVAPALTPPAAGEFWAGSLLTEVLVGLPVAVGAAVPIWVATMTGGLLDVARGASGDGPALPVVEGKASPLGVLFSLLASVAFLASGGPARVALALAEAPSHDPMGPFLRTVATLASAATIATAVAAPVLAAGLLLEVVIALAGRVATPLTIAPALSPLKGLAVLAVVALLAERMTALLWAMR
jgi:type III secretory pathway component EscT